MSYTFYVVLHVTGIVFTFTALGAAAMANAAGIRKQDNPARGLISAGHGVGLLLVLVSGFGMMAKLGMMGSSWPVWLIAKIFIWLIVGALLVPLLRKPGIGKMAIIALPLVVALAGWLAKGKPGHTSDASDLVADPPAMEGSGVAE